MAGQDWFTDGHQGYSSSSSRDMSLAVPVPPALREYIRYQAVAENALVQDIHELAMIRATRSAFERDRNADIFAMMIDADTELFKTDMAYVSHLISDPNWVPTPERNLEFR